MLSSEENLRNQSERPIRANDYRVSIWVLEQFFRLGMIMEYANLTKELAAPVSSFVNRQHTIDKIKSCSAR